MASQDDRDRGGTGAGLEPNEEQARQVAGRASEREGRVGRVKAQAQTVVGPTLKKRDVDSA